MCTMKELAQIGIGSAQQILILNFLIGEAENWSHAHTHTHTKTSYKIRLLFWSLDCLHVLNGS